MPELPEVETTARALRARLEGRHFVETVQRRADLRVAMPAGLPSRLEGRTIIGIRRRAKYILVDLDDGMSLILHLGMSGRLVFDGPFAGAHEHLTFTFSDGTILRFVDPRRFGMLDLSPTDTLPQHRWFAHLGLEPLGNELCGPVLQSLLAPCRSPVKTAIMDQRRIVGVGNIYACESLHAAGISPRRLAANVGEQRADRLAGAIREVLLHAIDAGGSSLRDYVQSSGELGNFQNFFRVYDRAGTACTRCGSVILKTVQNGRATYYCSGCQR